MGAVVGDYDVAEVLGSGSFGHVYGAVHRVIGKRAALKVLHAEHVKSDSLVRRFLAEAKAVNAIRHRGIVDIFDFGQLDDGRQFFAMERLEGETLEDRVLREGRLELSEAMPILRRMARALDAAHQAGIAHRDLKPENIYLTEDGEGGTQPKLLDFGIAKLMTEGHSSQTQTGQMLGTPLYMSPEQWRGKRVDHRTDIWSLGVVAYQMLSGALPFDGESPGDVMIKVCTEGPTPLRNHVPQYAGAIEAAIQRMLGKYPKDRPNSATEAVRDLCDAAALVDTGLVMVTHAASIGDSGAGTAIGTENGRAQLVGDELSATVQMEEQQVVAGTSSPRDEVVEVAGEGGVDEEGAQLSAEAMTATLQERDSPTSRRHGWAVAMLLICGGAAVVLGRDVPSSVEARTGTTATVVSKTPDDHESAPARERDEEVEPAATASSTAAAPSATAAHSAWAERALEVPTRRHSAPRSSSPPLTPPPSSPPPPSPPSPSSAPPPSPSSAPPPSPPPPGGIDLPVDTR